MEVAVVKRAQVGMCGSGGRWHGVAWCMQVQQVAVVVERCVWQVCVQEGVLLERQDLNCGGVVVMAVVIRQVARKRGSGRALEENVVQVHGAVRGAGGRQDPRYSRQGEGSTGVGRHENLGGGRQIPW